MIVNKSERLYFKFFLILAIKIYRSNTKTRLKLLNVNSKLLTR